MLPEIIAAFRQEHPSISFRIDDVIADGVMSRIRDETADIGLTGGKIVEQGFETLLIGHDQMHVVYPEGHPLETCPRIDATALCAFPLVLMHPATSVRSVVDAAFTAAGLAAEVAGEATYISIAVGMVRAGLGVAILPGSAMEVRAVQTLCARAIEGSAFLRPITLVWKAGRTLPPASALFAKTLTERLGTMLSNENPTRDSALISTSSAKLS